MKRLGLVVGLAVLLLGAMPIWANTIDFRGGSGGSIFFDPSAPNATISVTNAPIDQVYWPSLGLGSAQALVGGLMSFETGAETSGSVVGNNFSGFFGSGGFFTITGAIPTIGINDTSTVLLTGAFSSLAGPFTGNYASLIGDTGDGTFSGLLYISDFNQTFHDYFFGGTTATGSGSTAEPLLSVGYAGNTFTGEVSSSNVKITVPEPATWLMFGAGLIVCGFILRRRLEPNTHRA